MKRKLYRKSMSGKKKKVKITDIVLTLKMIIKTQLCLTLTVDFFVSILFPICSLVPRFPLV